MKRIKIEVLIVKNNLVCLCEFKTKYGSFYGFPGGGVEDGNTFVETAKLECLEEVGIKIKNPTPLGVIMESKPVFIKEDRINKYTGITIHFYYAFYEKKDYSIYGRDNDSIKYKWVTIDEAINKVKDNGDFGIFKEKALVSLKDKLTRTKEMKMAEW